MEKKVGTNNPLVKGKILIVSCSLIRVRNGTPALVLSGAVLGTLFFNWIIFFWKKKENAKNKEKGSGYFCFSSPSHRI